LGEGEQEISRLDMQHYMFRWEFGGDLLAPVSHPTAILDVACGTGRWAREMGRRFPDAAVVGFDINREQIDRSLEEGARRGTDPLPANCTFVAGDALQPPWEFADGAFTLTFARAVSSFIPIARWPAVVAEMARVTAPGGWVELRDFGLARSRSRALSELTTLFASMAAGRGLYPGAGGHLAEHLRAAGLRGVRTRSVTVRNGSRTTRSGRLMLADYLAVLERFTPLVERAGVTSQSQWEALLAQARQETVSAPTEVELTAAFGQR
jgi:SAM-dependent methyltransferase